MFENALAEGLSQLGMTADEDRRRRLERYCAALLEKNEVMNLTAARTMEELALRHVCDCLYIIKCRPLGGLRIIDVGTGGGFPGMILKLWDPSLDITLLDSTGKKLDFIAETARAMGIDVPTVNMRAEEAARGELRESFDLALSRAVAPMNVLAELCLGLVRPGGAMMAMKSATAEADAELAAAESAVRAMGAGGLTYESYALEGVTRRIVTAAKLTPTDPAYPRKYPRIAKRPL